MNLTPIELGHQIRDLAHKMEAQGAQAPEWIVCAYDIAPRVTDAVVAAGLSLAVHARGDMPEHTNFHMGSGEVPQ